MAQIIINVPDAQEARLGDAVASRHGWTAASGLTKKQFVKKYLIDILKEDLRAVESQAAKEPHRIAGESAATAAIASVDSEVTLT